MATKTLYLENTALFTEQWRKSETAPAAADEVTSLKNGKVAAGNYFCFRPGITDNNTYGASFQEIASLWRSQVTYSGTFASGNFTIAFKVKNRAAYAHAGQVYARIYRTTVANPAVGNLTKMNSVDGASSTITFSATAGQIITGTLVVNCNQNLVLTNEYLVIILNWKVTTAGGNTNAGVKYMVNEGAAEDYLTTNWTPAVVVITGSAAGSGVGTASIAGKVIVLASASSSGAGAGSSIGTVIKLGSASASGMGDGQVTAVVKVLAFASALGAGSGQAAAYLIIPAAAGGSGSGMGAASAVLIILSSALASGIGTGLASGNVISPFVSGSAYGSGQGNGQVSPLVIVISPANGEGIGVGRAEALLTVLAEAVASGIGSGQAASLVKELAAALGEGNGSGWVITSVYYGVLKRWDGGAWVKEPLEVYLSGSWQAKPLKRWDGSAWKEVDITG